MKNAAVLACTFLLLSVAAFAQTPGKTVPLTQEALAMILGKPAATGSCAPAASKAVFAAQKPAPPGGVGAFATCTAVCDTGTKQCTGSTCSAVDRNCAVFQRGYVTCDSATQWCDNACPNDYCYNCAQTGACYDCCRCDGDSAVICNNCCACQATSDCISCCRCEGNSLSYCASICY